MKDHYRKKKRFVRVELAFALVLALALTTVLSGVSFAAGEGISEEDEYSPIKPAPVQGGGTALSDEASGLSPIVLDELRKQQTNTLGSSDAGTLKSPEIKPPESHLLKNGEPIDDGQKVEALYEYIRWEPYVDKALNIPENGFQAGGNKAGNTIAFTVAGKNQGLFFATVPSYSGDTSVSQALINNKIGIGTEALIPAGTAFRYDAEFGAEEYWFEGKYDDEWDVSDPPFQYTHNYSKAATFTDRVIYQKWTVVGKPNPDAPDSNLLCWELDTVNKWYQDFNFTLQGYVYYDADGGRNVTKWINNGAKYPKVSVKRKGFKSGGWYTKFPTGGAKVKLGKTKAWFGEGYVKVVYVHWNKKVKITYSPNKGKITKGKKSVKVNYRGKLGKAPTASRSGYSSLGWYYGRSNNYTLHDKKLIVLVSKATFKAQWIKNGKSKTVSAAEWSRILKAYEKGLYLKYKPVKSAIGGAGMYNGTVNYYIGSDGWYNYYIKCKEYEWNGNKDDTIVKMYFAASSGILINGVRTGGLK